MHEYSSILGPVDSAFYYVERHETPMNIGALTIFEGHIDFDELVRLVEARVPQAPRYQQRVVQATMNMGQPTWIDDPDFYVGNHVRRVRIEPPATEEHLRELVGKLLSRTLNRAKPLWEVYLIEGLKDQTAIFFKVHHCMVDGLAAVELFTFLLDLSPKYNIPEYTPLFDPPPLPSPQDLLVDSVLRDIPHRFGLVNKLVRETVRLGSVLTDSEKRLKMMVAVAHLINGNLQPIKKLPVNGKNSGRQLMVWAEFSLDEVHAIRKKARSSVNDVMMAVLAKAVQKYSAARGCTDQPFLRILMPVNVRAEEEKGEYGNRISVLPVDIPFNDDDPLEHLQAVTEFTTVMKESSLAYSMDMILTLPSLMPAPLQSSIWGMAPTAFSLLAHTWCTNVAGPPLPVYLLGHRMLHSYGFFPLNPSMGLACVILSYSGRIAMTLVVDTGIVDDEDELLQNLKDSFVALRKAAGVPEMDISTIDTVEVATVKVPEPEHVAVAANGAMPDVGVAAAVLSEAVVIESASIEDSTQESIDEKPVEPETEAAPAESVVPVRERYKLFSDEWAKALREVINHSEAYRRVSRGWTAGSLAFVMETAPRHGFDAPAAVLMDLHRGECRSARALPLQEALKSAAFVIQGNYGAWMDVLHGRSAPLVMLSTGRLLLRKGSLLRLMPHTRSAGELVRCAQRVPWT
jgi:WS/DGAT/MGAT family acyltransferase